MPFGNRFRSDLGTILGARMKRNRFKVDFNRDHVAESRILISLKILNEIATLGSRQWIRLNNRSKTVAKNMYGRIFSLVAFLCKLTGARWAYNFRAGP